MKSFGGGGMVAPPLRYDSIMPTQDESTSGAGGAARGMEAAREKLIVALDVSDAAQAQALIDRLEGTCRWFKVGLELFISSGPDFVASLASRGYSIFLDLKFHDIPNTVAGAVRSAARLGAKMLTIHAGGGSAMLGAAREALERVANPPQLLAVTVLTSMDQAQLDSVGIIHTVWDQVELLARTGLDAGIRGFVCSPQEVSTLRALTGPEGVLVIPGIRPAGVAAGDQKRIATPAETLRSGASYLVVGRPITQAENAAAATEAIVKEMAEAL